MPLNVMALQESFHGDRISVKKKSEQKSAISRHIIFTLV